MAELVVATCVKNEAGKFWRSALKQWSRFADRVIVLDDNSTDDTVGLAERAGATVYRREDARQAWGNESFARRELFDIAMQETKKGDFVLYLDADMVPARDPRELALMGTSNAWAFTLYDIWTVEPLRYRWDKWWIGHEHPRIWMVERPATLDDYVWNPRGIHCGHLPTNFRIDRQIGVAPKEYALLHFAYSSPELRAAKYEQYRSVGDKLSNHEWAHAQTIIDASPQTYALPFIPDYTLEIEPPLEVAA